MQGFRIRGSPAVLLASAGDWLPPVCSTGACPWEPLDFSMLGVSQLVHAAIWVLLHIDATRAGQRQAAARTWTHAGE